MTLLSLWNPGDAVLIWVVNVLLQLTLITAMALTVASMLRRSPAIRYWVLFSCLLLALFSPLLAALMQSSGISLLTVSIMQETTEIPADDAAAGPLTTGFRTSSSRPTDTTGVAAEFEGDAVIERINFDTTAHAGAHRALTESSNAAETAGFPVETVGDVAGASSGGPSETRIGFVLRIVVPPLLIVWVFGAFLQVVRLLVGWTRLAAILRSATPNTDDSLTVVFRGACRSLGVDAANAPELVLSDRIPGPVAAGVRRPAVVLPERIVDRVNAKQLHDILVHEVAHIVRRDQIVVLLQNFAGAIFWLHPLARMLNRQLAQAREEVCDNHVLTATDAPSYGRTLLALAELVQTPQPIPGAVGLFTSRWKLEQRVAGLLDERRNRTSKLTNRAKLLVAALSLTLAAVATVSTVTLADGKESDPQSESQTVVANTETNTSSATQVGQKANVPVLRGNGKHREILVKGRVLDINGTPARDFDLSVKLHNQSSREPLPTKIEGEQFEVWVPIGGDDWFFLVLSAKTKDGLQRANQGIVGWTLRQAALEGVVLQLAHANRPVEISVTSHGTPIAAAHVVATTDGTILLRGETNDEGKMTLRLLEHQKLRQLTAWSDDFLIGGYSFSRKPRHDPLGTEFAIALEDCRDQTIRFLQADDDSPVPDVGFQLTIGTGAPNFNFPAVPGSFPHLDMVTDKQGEAVCRWFPDWEKHGAYVTIVDPRWAKASGLATADDGALVMKLKRRVHRKPLVGKITSERFDVGGLMLQIRSSQAEEAGYSDHVYAFTDANGNFTADCIPGSTYCVCVNDARLTSETIDLIPFETDTGRSNTAELTVSKGELVEIRVTSGPNRRPMANQYINLHTNHMYTWYENGDPRSGAGGRAWGMSTDDSGVVRAYVLAGSNLMFSVSAGEWRSSYETVTVKADEVTRIDIHRDIDVARTVTGRLVAPPSTGVDLANAEIVYGSIGGETDEKETTKADAQGRFAFKTIAIQLGIFAYTADGKAAGVLRPRSFDEPVELQLKPTVDLHGQLLGRNDEPLSDHAVRAHFAVRGKRDSSKSFSTRLAAKIFETRTDRQGNYTLKNLPCESDMTLQADSLNGSINQANLGDVFLISGESRPHMVSHLDRTRKPDTRSLAEKYERALRDVRLGGFHLLVMVFDSTLDDFVRHHLVEDKRTKEVSSFMSLRIRENDVTDEGTRQFVEFSDWPQPKPDIVFACALDGTGKELGRVTLDTRSADVQVQVAKFIRKHALPQADAKAKWDAAFAEAERSGRRVWARIGQRVCGPCFRLSRWLDDNRELLERDYVLLKIDDLRDQHGVEIAKRIVSDREHFALPFHTIFDATKKRLIDSVGPAGNIGHPSGYEGRTHLTKMLRQTRKNLTEAQIQQVVAMLE